MRTVVVILGLLMAGTALPRAGLAQAPTDSTYTVQSGDTLYSIAQRFGVSVEELQRWNGLEGTGLQIGQTLRVRPPRAAPSPTNNASSTDTSSADTTASTDTSAAADPLAAGDTTAPADTATADTVTADSTTADTVAADTTTVDSAATAPSTAADVTGPTGPPPLYGRHTAEPGDTFVHLALRLGTTADTLYALNDSSAAPLSAGQTLRLPKRFAPPSHTVQPEETLYSIAGQYGVSARVLRTANALDTTTVQPGQRLRLPGREAPEVPAPGDWAAPDSTGAVAVYPEAFAGRLTASGAPYDPDDLVVSHPSLPYGTVLLLTRPDADRHAFVRVIDRGPLDEGVLLDVSAAVAEQLGIGGEATPTVAVRTVWIEGRPE